MKFAKMRHWSVVFSSTVPMQSSTRDQTVSSPLRSRRRRSHLVVRAKPCHTAVLRIFKPRVLHRSVRIPLPIRSFSGFDHDHSIERSFWSPTDLQASALGAYRMWASQLMDRSLFNTSLLFSIFHRSVVHPQLCSRLGPMLHKPGV